jgi:hypothetical protein
MLIRFAVFILLTMGTALAVDSRAIRLTEIDKNACSAFASKNHTWVMQMTAWRESYNHCLRTKLKALGARYVNSALEAIRLEDLCPESSLNGTPIDLSMMGIHIVNSMTARDLQKSTTSKNLEQTLELYYQRLIQSNARIRELRH